MPKISEGAFNVEFANVLRRKHPAWRVGIKAEQYRVFRQRMLRPDVLVNHPGGLPVAIELEFEPARDVERDAKARLQMVLGAGSGRIEQAVAVRVPRSLSESQSDLVQRIDDSQFAYCSFSDTGDGFRRWPRTGWIHGDASDLASCIERVSVSERLLAEGMEILETAVRRAAGDIRQDVRWGYDKSEVEIAELLYQQRGDQTNRMAMSILASALIFHNVIAKSPRVKGLDKLKSELGGYSVSDVIEEWYRVIREVNYWPIFRIAIDILASLFPPTSGNVLTLLANAAVKLSQIGATNLHDMSGRMFQCLIADRKFLATFYTLPNSATFLSELAVARIDCNWESARALRKLRIADLACGTGILISAAYHAVLGRHRRSGGDDAKVHRGMMERSLIAADIMPAAAHLAASMLSSAHPGRTFRNTRIYTMPYGKQGPGLPLALGSLDLILRKAARPLFGTGRTVARGDRPDDAIDGGAKADPEKEVVLKHGSADLIIMNPPFTRPTNHESATVPVPSFAGFGKADSEQKEMSRLLVRIRKSIAPTAGHGNAGLASNFFDLAHLKAKPGGVLALVLPASSVRGRSWRGMRGILEDDYRDLIIVSLATVGVMERAFSADTGMAEVLVVATKKRRRGETSGDALFVNLHHRPRNLAEAAETARVVTKLQPVSRFGKVRVGDADIVGCYVKAPLREGGCAALREPGIARMMLGFRGGRLVLPRMEELPVPVCGLGQLGIRGLLHRDIYGKEEGKSGLPRGPFDVVPIDRDAIPMAAYPMLWAHRAERERRFEVDPDSKGEVKPKCNERAVDLWQETATRMHFTLDFQLNSQSLVACVTPQPSIGGRAWPNFRLHEPALEPATVLCANTTLGLISFWWLGMRQQLGRAMVTIETLPRLCILDPRSLGESGVGRARRIYDSFREREFLPANEAYRDPARQDLDRAVLVDLFGLPETVLEPLAVIRNQWCAEPTVHGGKSTQQSGAA